MQLIESEGLLYRGTDPRRPEEAWHYAQKRWVSYSGGQWASPGAVIDEPRAEALKFDNPDAEHFLYYDDPPWRHALGEAHRMAVRSPRVQEAIARRQQGAQRRK